jgi:hypothetical protein
VKVPPDVEADTVAKVGHGSLLESGRRQEDGQAAVGRAPVGRPGGGIQNGSLKRRPISAAPATSASLIAALLRRDDRQGEGDAGRDRLLRRGVSDRHGDGADAAIGLVVGFGEAVPTHGPKTREKVPHGARRPGRDGLKRAGEQLPHAIVRAAREGFDGGRVSRGAHPDRRHHTQSVAASMHADRENVDAVEDRDVAGVPRVGRDGGDELIRVDGHGCAARPAAAIGRAVFDATRVRLRRASFTPDRVKAAPSST